MDYILKISGDFGRFECYKCPCFLETELCCDETTLRCAFGGNYEECPLEEATVAENATVEGEWIETSERLPEDENTMYWTTHEDGSLVMHGYSKAHGFIYNWEVHDLEKRKRQGGVIAWMPLLLPKPYKKGGAE